jgi:hypothetical protein
MKNVLFILFLIVSVTGNIHSQLIPDDRRIKWSPGIPGGIPHITHPIANVLHFGADPAGGKDSYQSFVKAMNSLPESGGIVFIPSGSYRIDSTIRITRSNIVFKGDKPHVPRLHSYANGNSIEIRPVKKGNWISLISGYEKNSNSVKTDNTTDFLAYQFAEIQQENDSILMYTKPDWIQQWSENSVGQIFEIDRLTSNTIFLKNSLNISFSTVQKPMIRPVEMIVNTGFEDLYIEKMIASDHTFHFENTAYCWIRNVESYHTRRTHVSIAASFANEVRESYFHHSFDYGGGGSGYGVECRMHTTNTLVENNIFDSLRHAMMVQTGANGNVFAYNYSVNPVQGEGEVNLNKGWIPPDISVHGHYPFMNLFEGNHVSEIGIADYWGPAGPGNTFFRNRVIDEGIFIYDHTHRQNVVGNETTKITHADESGRDNIETANVIKNIEQVNPITILNATLYMNEKPSFLNGFNWPVFGPDVPGENKLPAQIRYEEILKKKR